MGSGRNGQIIEHHVYVQRDGTFARTAPCRCLARLLESPQAGYAVGDEMLRLGQEVADGVSGVENQSPGRPGPGRLQLSRKADARALAINRWD